jgi:multiple sugar transport system substrate-binding protein
MYRIERRQSRGALLRGLGRGAAVAGAAGAWSAVVACAGAGGGGAAAQPARVEGVVEIISTGEADPTSPAWQARVAAIRARYPALTIEATVAPFGSGGQAYDEKVISLAAAGTVPDITWVDGTRLSNFYPRGILRELDSYLARSRFDKSNYVKAAWVADERNGKTIALPYRSQPYPFYINRDLYARGGLRPPSTEWTWETLIEHGRRLTAPDGTQWGINELASTVSRYSMFIWAAGGDFFDKGYTRCLLDQLPAIEGLQFIADLINRHRAHVPPGVQGVSFAAGNVAITSTGAGRLPATPYQFQWGFATMPRGPKGADVCLITQDWAMFKGARNPEGAWRVIEWLVGDESQKMLTDEDALPANLRVARQSAFSRLDQESRQAILRTLDTGRNLPYDAPLWGEVRPMWENELPRLWRGEVTARELMQRIVPQVNERLKQALR